MDLMPQEKVLIFSELSENRALKPFAQFRLQPAASVLMLVTSQAYTKKQAENESLV